MKTISLHQPWASLLVTRQPCDFGEAELTGDRCRHPMVKRIETRSWRCPPKLIGQRIAFHAAKRRPPSFWQHERDDICTAVNAHSRTVDPVVPLDLFDHFYGFTESSEADGWWLYRWDEVHGPLGAIVGSGVVEACLPIVDLNGCSDNAEHVCHTVTGELLHHRRLEVSSWDTEFDISDQFPFGDFTPGRFAWLITDAAPTTERCPWCLGDGCDSPCLGAHPDDGRPHNPCPACGRAGHCDPTPARGRQRIWEWSL